MTVLVIGGFLLGYLFGSIPSGLWLVQAVNGIDIRLYGNAVGTSDVYRVAGPKMAVSSFGNCYMPCPFFTDSNFYTVRPLPFPFLTYHGRRFSAMYSVR